MRLLPKIFLLLITVLLIAVVILYVYFTALGKSLIISELEKITKVKVSIGSMLVSFPLNITLGDLEIGNTLRAGYVSVSPSILGIITGSPVLNSVRINRLKLTYERVSADKPAVETAARPDIRLEPAIVEPASEPSAEPNAGNKSELPISQSRGIVIKDLSIHESELVFYDMTLDGNPLKIAITQIEGRVTNIVTSHYPAVTRFDLKGIIPWESAAETGKLSFNGWIDLHKKDIQATLRAEDIDGIYIYPYYKDWVDLEKARIEKAKLLFTSVLGGVDNVLTADCRLELTDIVRRPPAAEEQEERISKITNAVLDILKTFDQGKIALDFKIKTKLDHPEFGLGDIKLALEEKITRARKGTGITAETVAIMPFKVLEGAVKGTAGVTTSIITGAISAGKLIGETIGYSFKKEPQEAKEEGK